VVERSEHHRGMETPKYRIPAGCQRRWRQCGAADGRRSNRCILASRRDAGVTARPIPAVALR